MRVRWSARALVQLREAHAYIAKDNASAALGFVDAAAALVELLEENPGMGIKTDEPDVIMFPLIRYRYLIFYKILHGEEVRIIRIRHAARKRLN